ncbi:amidase domain-containing protein [Niallia sp. 03133]|uniref:amidase domain-containing protein n=1 Tax=Niallia sp. 03133 TaxID=3458060 RepID=UPI004043CBB6
MKQQLLELLQKRMEQYVSSKRTPTTDDKIARKQTLCQKRNADILKVKAKGNITSVRKLFETDEVFYQTHLQYLIKQKESFYMEEEIERRKAVFYKEILIEDKEMPVPFLDEVVPFLDNFEIEADHKRERNYTYNRLKAVQYAEKWWNSYNPAYKTFEVDCTNYISQCVRAGGAPMRGYPNRNNGWWMQNNNWSYSWAVANAFPKYLATSTRGFRAKQVANASDLLLGDVICYDFQGDGKFDHTTIVTAKDENGEPLVNAHTYNSRNRYWAYEDSTAYTPNIKYKFFSIIDG